LGTFRLKEAIRYNCCSQTFTISRTADKWYVSFTIKADRIPPLYHEVSEPTGIDLGVSTFATLSDGTVYQLPNSLKKAKIKLGKLQYRNRNKQLGNRKLGIKASKNAQKFYRNQAKQHADIAQGRRDFLQKTTTEISQKYAHIRIEDLNVSGMVANHKLAASVVDSGFYEFRRFLTYKSPIYGTIVELVDRWYPSSKTCSSCSHVQPMPLQARVFVCEACGNNCNRDLNAAINLASVPKDRVRMASPELTPVE
jgi:putative transposase